MKVAIQAVVVPVSLVLSVCALKAGAMEAEVRPGDWVTTTADPTVLKVEAQIVAELPPGTDLVAGNKQGPMLWLSGIYHGQQVKGCIPADAVRRLGESGQVVEERLGRVLKRLSAQVTIATKDGCHFGYVTRSDWPLRSL